MFAVRCRLFVFIDHTHTHTHTHRRAHTDAEKQQYSIVQYSTVRHRVDRIVRVPHL
jgi:hypothetical protein